MPLLPDIQIGALNGDIQAQIDAIVRQLNEWARLISAETRVKTTKGFNATDAIIDGELPDKNGFGYLLTDSEGVRRVILHIDANNNPKFKISKSGVDVTTATNDQLIFNSDQNVFKIVDSGVVTVNKPANAEVATEFIRHGFDYPPMVIAFANSSLDTSVHLNPLPDIRIIPSGYPESPGLIVYKASIGVDFLDIYFVVETPNVGGIPFGPYASNFSVDFHYYILQETAQPT